MSKESEEFMRMKQRTLRTAHSGAGNTLDNSLEFIRHILTTDADALEVDVRRERQSGRLVLSHDDKIGAPQTLQQAFQLLSQHPSIKINCDVKEAGLKEVVFQLAAQMGISDRLIFPELSFQTE